MTGRGEGASHTLSCSLFSRGRTNLSFAKPGWPTNSAILLINVGKVSLLTPPVFLPTGNSLVSYVWQAGSAGPAHRRSGDGPGRGNPRVVTCTWRGCARESVSRFGSEVLRVNPWILFVSRLGNWSAQSNLRLSHAKLPVHHREWKCSGKPCCCYSLW